MKSSFSWPLFAAALLAAITGELGCFSRIVALVARAGSPWAVVLGTLTGYILLLVPVLLWGEWLERVLPPAGIRWGSGLLFLGFGLWLLFGPHHSH